MAADGLPVLSTTVTLTGSARGDRALPAQQGMILNNMRFPDNGVDVLQTAAIDAPAMPAPTTTTSGSFVRILTPPRRRPPCVRRARFRADPLLPALAAAANDDRLPGRRECQPLRPRSARVVISTARRRLPGIRPVRARCRRRPG